LSNCAKIYVRLQDYNSDFAELTAWLCGQHSFFIPGRSQVQSVAQKLTTLTDVFGGFAWFIKAQLLPYTSFSIHYSQSCYC